MLALLVLLASCTNVYERKAKSLNEQSTEIQNYEKRKMEFCAVADGRGSVCSLFDALCASGFGKASCYCFVSREAECAVACPAAGVCV